MSDKITCQAPKVTLIDWARDPMALTWQMWRASKDNDPLPSAEDVRGMVPEVELEDLFRKVLAQRIPVSEAIWFTFVLENVSVSWREQAVRHRIGIEVGPRIGMDIVPDLAKSSWWSQSMRILNMGQFAAQRAYRLPDFSRYIKGNKDQERAEKRFHQAMNHAEDAYRRLVSLGLPEEEAREVIPLGAHHRISWTLNLAAIQHIIGKRSCWILQSVLWAPVIRGMVDEMTANVHPIFRELVQPPCVSEGKFKRCAFRLENARRAAGADPLPICPLWACCDMKPTDVKGTGLETLASPGMKPHMRAATLLKNPGAVLLVKEMNQRAMEYLELWGRDPYTWDEVKP